MDATESTLPRNRRRRIDFRRFWLALRRRDVAAAERLLSDTLTRATPGQVYLRLIAPALNLSGVEYERGGITFSDEHFITYQILRLLRRVRREFVEPAPSGPVALAGAVAQESHRIGLRMVCDFLQSANWRIQWIGGVERGILRASLREWRPRMLLLSIGMHTGIEPTRRLIAEARRDGFSGLIAIGGRAVVADPQLVPSLGADLTAANGLELLRKVQPLTRLSGPHRLPANQFG